MARDAEHDLERIGYLFGYPLAHSMSPLLHQAVYENLGLRWAQRPLESTDIPALLELARRPDFLGASVTMPHKVAIIPYLDELTPEARDVGACNTVFVRSNVSTGVRELVGTNTDVIGVRDALAYNVSGADVRFAGRPALVLGGGGAARAAVYALRRYLRSADVYLVNRDMDEAAAVITDCAARGFGGDIAYIEDVATVRQLVPPAVIVACVPDFPPSTPAEQRARDVFLAFLALEPKGAMLEMCYHPAPWTENARLARAAGWQVILGTEAMIYQGLEQDTYWTGRPLAELPVEAVKAGIAAQMAKSGSMPPST